MNHLVTMLKPIENTSHLLTSLQDLPQAIQDVAIFKQALDVISTVVNVAFQQEQEQGLDRTNARIELLERVRNLRGSVNAIQEDVEERRSQSLKSQVDENEIMKNLQELQHAFEGLKTLQVPSNHTYFTRLFGDVASLTSNMIEVTSRINALHDSLESRPSTNTQSESNVHDIEDAQGGGSIKVQLTELDFKLKVIIRGLAESMERSRDQHTPPFRPTPIGYNLPPTPVSNTVLSRQLRAIYSTGAIVEKSVEPTLGVPLTAVPKPGQDVFGPMEHVGQASIISTPSAPPPNLITPTEDRAKELATTDQSRRRGGRPPKSPKRRGDGIGGPRSVRPVKKPRTTPNATQLSNSTTHPSILPTTPAPPAGMFPPQTFTDGPSARTRSATGTLHRRHIETLSPPPGGYIHVSGGSDSSHEGKAKRGVKVTDLMGLTDFTHTTPSSSRLNDPSLSNWWSELGESQRISPPSQQVADVPPSHETMQDQRASQGKHDHNQGNHQQQSTHRDDSTHSELEMTMKDEGIAVAKQLEASAVLSETTPTLVESNGTSTDMFDASRALDGANQSKSSIAYSFTSTPEFSAHVVQNGLSDLFPPDGTSGRNRQPGPAGDGQSSLP